MLETFTPASFAEHVGSRFRVQVEGQEPLDLELFEISRYEENPDYAARRQPFSLLLVGPLRPVLPQATYPLEHPAFGRLVGARGLMQLMPATASEMADRLDTRYPADGLYDPEFSIELGAAYLAQLIEMFDGNVELALAGYNGGPNRILRMWNEAGPRPELDDFVENMDLDESRDYVKRILVLADSYRQLYPAAG